jgi:hypothetical protein
MRLVLASSLLVLALGACAFPDSMLWKSDANAAAPKPAAQQVAAAQPVPTPAPPAAAPAPAPAPPAAPPAETRKPFVVIRFEAPDPDYAQPLYEALKRALDRKPGVSFDLVAVTRHVDDAQKNLADVYHTVTDMGVPPSRLSLSSVAASDDRTNEVWIYVR